METTRLKSPTRILEELIRFRAENVASISMVIYPEALVDLLDEKDNKIKKLEKELLQMTEQCINVTAQL